MTQEEFNALDLESQRLLRSIQGQMLSFEEVEQGVRNDLFTQSIIQNTTQEENIRGMQNVSPLATMKFYGRNADETFNTYFPDAENLQRGNTNVVADVGVPITRNGFQFNSEDYYFDNNHNGTFGDTGDILAFKLLLFVSTDGLKVKECYEVTEPEDDEVILFLETDGGLSKQVLYGKMSAKVRARFTENGNLKSNLYDNEIMKGVRKYYSDANQEVIEELMKKGYVEGSIIKEGFFKLLKYMGIATTALPKVIGWVLEKLGNGIDFLKIPEEFWDTENEAYFLKKENLLERFTISTDGVKKLEELLNNKEGLNVTDLMPQAIEEGILYVLAKMRTVIERYNQFVTQKIEEIYEAIDNPAADFVFSELAESFAFLAGFWNGAVDFISGVFKFAGALLQAPFDLVSNYEDTLEMMDNFWDAITNQDFWSKLWESMVLIYQKIKKEVKDLKLEDLNWVRIAYFSGFGLAFIASFFVPFANIANVGRVGKLGKIMATFTEEISSGFVKGATILTQKNQFAYQNTLKIFREILELISQGGKKLEAFFDDIWKKIVAWFKRNVKQIKRPFKKRPKTRKPTRSDIDELAKVRKLFNAGRSKNVAFTKGKIGGKKIDLKSRSGKPKGTPENFDNFKTIKPENYQYKNGPLNRSYDSEQKQIEYLYHTFKHNKNVKGKIEIVSDLKICDNCNDIIKRFQNDFPNIEIVKVWVKNKL